MRIIAALDVKTKKATQIFYYCAFGVFFLLVHLEHMFFVVHLGCAVGFASLG